MKTKQARTETISKNKPSWEDRSKQFKDWVWKGHQRNARWYDRWSFWYYSQAFGMAIIGLVGAKLAHWPERVEWIYSQGEVRAYFPANDVYFLAWFTFIAFLAGVCLFYISTGFWTIREYCRKVITKDEVFPFDPDRTGGLKELGRLSLDLDLMVALPSLIIVIYIILDPSIFTGWVGKEFIYALTGLYTLLLVLVFFISLSPAHGAMIESKSDHLKDLHSEYRDIHEKLMFKLKSKGEKLKSEDYKIVKGLYDLFDRADSMSVWPLDYRIMLRFILTSILPLIAALITITITPFPATPSQSGMVF